MQRYKILLTVVMILIAGCAGTPLGGPPSSEENKTDDNNTPEVSEGGVEAKYTDQLSERIDSYEQNNRTGGISVIIVVESGSDAKFNSTVNEINQTVSRIRSIFPDQRMIAATASPSKIREVAEYDTVTQIGIDEEVVAN
jgi:hypothetical protein